MFRQRIISKNDVASGCDKQLSALLHKWPDIEPGIGFETGVLKRIAAGKELESRRLVCTLRLSTWMPVRPVWVTSAAVAAAIVIGIGVGIVTFRTAPVSQASHPLLHQHTVAGAYVAMARGETR